MIAPWQSSAYRLLPAHNVLIHFRCRFVFSQSYNVAFHFKNVIFSFLQAWIVRGGKSAVEFARERPLKFVHLRSRFVDDYFRFLGSIWLHKPSFDIENDWVHVSAGSAHSTRRQTPPGSAGGAVEMPFDVSSGLSIIVLGFLVPFGFINLCLISRMIEFMFLQDRRIDKTSNAVGIGRRRRWNAANRRTGFVSTRLRFIGYLVPWKRSDNILTSRECVSAGAERTKRRAEARLRRRLPSNDRPSAFRVCDSFFRDFPIVFCLKYLPIVFRNIVSMFLQARNVREDGQQRASDGVGEWTAADRLSGFVSIRFRFFGCV